MEIDHIIFASRDVPAGSAMIAELTGAAAVPGGPHVGLGTHNYLMTFDDRTYFEIIGVDPDQDEPDRPRPFGLDERDGPGVAGWAIHPTGGETLEDVADQMRAAGFDPGSIIEMSRRKPTGELITWSLTVGGDTGPASQGALPFAIAWGDQPSPAVSLPSMGSLIQLEVTHPDPAVRASVQALGLDVSVAEGPAALKVVMDTAKGRVELT